MDGLHISLGYNHSERDMAVASMILFLTAGLSEGLMDWLQFRLNPTHKMWRSMFWNAQYSWRNKWRNGDPMQGERFWQSSRLFVFVTDGWHLMKFVRNLTVMLGVLHIAICNVTLFEAILIVIICRLFYGLGFSLSYNWLHKV